MTGLRTTIVAAVLMALILVVSSENKVVQKRATYQIMTLDQFLQTFCQNSFFSQYWYACPATTTTAATSATTQGSIVTTNGQTVPGQVTTSSYVLPSSTPASSSLERAHWCSFNNGSYIPLGYTFMYTSCAMCQCTQSRAIRCTNLQCVTAFCIDGSTPYARPDQCCKQCGYELTSSTCTYGGITFPHGTIVKITGNTVECWCQLGTIECRQGATTVLSGLDIWGAGTAVYVVVLIICVILLFGTLLCGIGGLFFYYYYYKRNQQTIDPYWNHAGWQPMSEEEIVGDASAEEKQAEAENQFAQEYPTGNAHEYIPPPYALYNGAYVSEQQHEKDQKYI